jgi:hypothetical protein
MSSFRSKCLAYNGTSVIYDNVTYTIQAAYVWGTSCYVLTLTATANWHTSRYVCTTINPEMHMAFLSTPQEFAVVDNHANHVCVVLFDLIFLINDVYSQSVMRGPMTLGLDLLAHRKIALFYI